MTQRDDTKGKPSVGRLIRWEELQKLVGYTRMTIHRRMKAGTFPQCYKLGVGKGGAVAWSYDEVVAWIETRQARAQALPILSQA